MADESERDDPVLVRPYITTQPAGDPTDAEAPGGPGDESAQTWPATADLPEDATGEQPVVVPAPAPVAKSTVLRRQRLRLLAALGVLALLGGAALLFLAPSDEDDPAPVAGPPPTMATLTATPGAAPVASGGARSLAPSSSGPTRSATATATATTTAPGAPAPNGNGDQPPAAGEPTPTLSPPPEEARTGQITAAGGRCLARGGFLGIGRNPVQTNGCADILYQRFTLATDGTLRVTDDCARVLDDGTVDLADCDDQPATQWRMGPNGSLVNLGTGRCLTDPGSGGATVTVTDCTGADTQRWKVP